MSEVKSIPAVSTEQVDANVESTPSPGQDPEAGNTEEAVQVVKPPHVPDPKHPTKEEVYAKLFGIDYNAHEVIVMVCAACIIAFNQGFVNGVCMSGLLFGVSYAGTPAYPAKQMIAGFAGGFTNAARFMLLGKWTQYKYSLFIILSYMVGAFIAAIINGQAKPYVIEPKYGPTFLIGGCMMLTASLLTFIGEPEEVTRYVFFLVTAAGGLSNGIASIYSANLIRCTLTGATTDIAIVLAQMCYGNRKGFGRSVILSLIVIWFWVGGIISVYATNEEKGIPASSLFVSACIYGIMGFGLSLYIIIEMDVAIIDAVLGTWKWNKVLKKLKNENGELTPEKLIEIYSQIDQEGGNNGQISADALRDGMRLNKVKMTDYEIKTLFRAADANSDGFIDCNEWNDLVKKIL